MIRDRRRSALAAIALVALALMTACTPEPAPSPSPSPTGFASEDEAFAAAEATYRAYVDAVNKRRLDQQSVPDPTDFLTGAARNEDLDTAKMLADRGWRVDGDTTIRSVRPTSASRDTVALTFCLDATNTRVLDESGSNVTPPDRATILGVHVEFDTRNRHPLISSTSTSSDPC